MARILLGWEFGANRGHTVRLSEIAAALRAAGHDVSFAVTRLDAMYAQKPPDAAIWQAPVSPRLMVGRARVSGAATSMADILARLGMDDPLIIAAMLDGWRRLLGAVRPDLVICDYAPFLALAARGRIPMIWVGAGFGAPPSDMDALPVLIPGAQGIDQFALLDTVNAGLARAGDHAIAALPAVFEADRTVVATFTEIDPYADKRKTPLAFPDKVDPSLEAGSGDEIFVYLPDYIVADSPLWTGLSASGLKVRVHIGLGGPEIQAAVAHHGLIVEPNPVPFARIAERSRLLLSHGGHGFLSAGMSAGLPHVVCHFDLEKIVHGLAIARAGLGGHVSLPAIQPRPFADSLVRMFNDDAMMARARTAALDFRARPQTPFQDAVLEAAAEFV